jgi:hypothetical protein
VYVKLIEEVIAQGKQALPFVRTYLTNCGAGTKILLQG